MTGEPRRGASLLSILASSTLAALAVIVLVGVLILAFGENGDDDGQVVVDDVPIATATPAATPQPEPTVTPTPSPTPTVEKVPIVVLNQTGVTGLAAEFQERLEAAGWTVAGIDDFRGNVPATTVYFPPNMRPVAKALMAQFPEIGRIRPAFSGISTTQLTVILGKDFPTSS